MPAGNVRGSVSTTNNIPLAAGWSIGPVPAAQTNPTVRMSHDGGGATSTTARRRGTNSTKSEKRRKRDQARQDRFRSSRMSRQQKSKMRQLTSGSKRFMKSLVLSHEELRDGVRSFDKAAADYSVPRGVDPEFSAVDRASETEA